jgi:uncharacterized membrane protein (UPF0127 family)
MHFPHHTTLHTGLGPNRLHVAVARRFTARLRGVIAASNWPQRFASDQPVGLLLPACTSVHGCFVRHPLDLLYLDGHAHVASQAGAHWSAQVVHTGRLLPWSVHAGRVSAVHQALGWRCRHVLELPAGAIDHYQVRPGDVLELHAWP